MIERISKELIESGIENRTISLLHISEIIGSTSLRSTGLLRKTARLKILCLSPMKLSTTSLSMLMTMMKPPNVCITNTILKNSSGDDVRPCSYDSLISNTY